MLGLVDKSDEVVIGTTEREAKVRTARRMLVGQRGDVFFFLRKEHQKCAVANKSS